MNCQTCELIQLAHPGALCESCVKTLQYLAEQDTACLTQANTQLSALRALAQQLMGALTRCLEYVKATEGSLPTRPNLVSPDVEKAAAALAAAREAAL